MKRQVGIRVWSIILICGLFFSSAGGSFTQRAAGETEDTTPNYAPGEVLVKFTTSLAVTASADGALATGNAGLDQQFADLGVTAVQPVFSDATVSSSGLERIYKLLLAPDADVMSAVATLAASQDIEYAEPNYVFTAQLVDAPKVAVQADVVVQQVPPVPPATPESETPRIQAQVRQALIDQATTMATAAGTSSITLAPAAVQYTDNWAYAELENMNTDAMPSGRIVSIALLHRVQEDAPWQVALPPTPTWQNWLDELPDILIDVPTKRYLLGTLIPSTPVTHYVGYRLPWSGSQKGEIRCVINNCNFDGGPYHGYPATDFGVLDDPTVRAAKSGSVVFRKDTSPSGCADISCWSQANLVVLRHGDTEYSWYMHLAPGSIPEEVQVGTIVHQGDIVGRQGCTGYCTGDHVHFMVSTVLSPTTNNENPLIRMPGWPTGQLASYDLAEIGWDRLTQVAYGEEITSTNSLNDQLYNRLWGLHNTGQTGGREDADIDAPEAWSVITSTDSVLIAVIDTGVDYRHEDLNDGRIRTDIDKDFVNNDDDAMDDHGHGTHVAGTIAAETNNGIGVAGVMWNARILPLKALDKNGSGTIEQISQAIRYAADKGARVINMSLGGGSCSQTLADAVNYAYFDKGVTLVAAAGNSGSSIGYPAKYAPVIAVGAVDHNDVRAFFSSYGDDLDVMAPGVTIFSTVPNNGYDAFSGTSMASPHVAGVAGLLLAQRSTLTNAQVREILQQSADDLGQGGFDRSYGYGRVNAYRALLQDTPSEVKAPKRAECPNEGCAATVALSAEPDGSNILTNLRAVRDQVFTQNPGRRWSQIYYQYQWEVAWIVVSDSQVRADATTGFRAFDPVFQALLSDNPDQVVTLTPALIEAAHKALMGVAAQGDINMRTTIEQEWNEVAPERFIGWDVRDVWAQLQRENQVNRIYLPQVER